MAENNISYKSRKSEHLFRRYYLMTFLRSKTDMTLKEIGSIFGKDHATVSNAIREVSNLQGWNGYEDVVKDVKISFPPWSHKESNAIDINTSELEHIALYKLQSNFLQKKYNHDEN